MEYVLTLLAIAAIPLAVGHVWAKRRLTEASIRHGLALLVAVLAALAWIGLAFAARWYAETDLPAWRFVEWWAQSGKWLCFGCVILFVLGVASGIEKPHPRPTRVALCCLAVVLTVWITVWRTIPVYPFIRAQSVRDAAGIMRQSTDYTCGPVSLANLAEQAFGLSGLSERDVARWSGTTYEGSTMGGLIRAAERMGLRVAECRHMNLAELERSGKPAIVFISTIPVVHHATVFVGLHDGTVTLIDPDRSGGRIRMSQQRFCEIWYGKTLILDGQRVAGARSGIRL